MATDEQIDALFDAMFVKNENRLAVKLRQNFRNVARDMQEAYLQGGESEAKAVISQNEAILALLLEEAYMISGQDSAVFTLRIMEDQEEDEDVIAEALAFLLLWAEPQSNVSSKQITKTTLKIADELFESMADATLSREKFIKSLTREFSKKNRGRISVISTTESGTAISVAQQKTAEALRFDLIKSWRSQRDRKVRETHMHADQRYTEDPIPLNEQYFVGASSGLFPRDPNLSIDERAGCRCYQKFKKAEI